jgi:hypothetical protein
MAIPELLNTRAEAVLKGILNIVNQARNAYTELNKQCYLEYQMELYATGETVSLVRMAEVRYIRERVKALQEVEDNAITAFTLYSVKLSQCRAKENERDFFDTLEQVRREYGKLEGDLNLCNR